MNTNGLNINLNCGSTTNTIKSYLQIKKSSCGISLDGDADRIIICDEKGKIIDGDQIIAMIALRWKKKNFKRGEWEHLCKTMDLKNFQRKK